MRLPFNVLKVIPYQKYSGLENMAIDRLLVERVVEWQTPVIRFYGWNPWCLSLGRHQSVTEVDREALKQRGFDLVRRPTGGSAILHARELTYSFVMPRQPGMDHHEMYEWLHLHLAAALNEAGYPVELSTASPRGNYLKGNVDVFACFNRKAKSEIHYKGKKVVGSAQKIYQEAILQHGSLMIGEEHREILSFLRLDGEEREKQKRLLQNNAIALNSIREATVTPRQLCAIILKRLNDYHLEETNPAAPRLENAKKYFDEFLL